MSSAHHNTRVNVFLREEADNGSCVTFKFSLKSSVYVDSRHYDLVFDLYVSPADSSKIVRPLYEAVIKTIEDHDAFVDFKKRSLPGRSGTTIIARIRTGSVRNPQMKASEIAAAIISMVRTELAPNVRAAAAIASLADSSSELVSVTTKPDNGYVNDPTRTGRKRRH